MGTAIPICVRSFYLEMDKEDVQPVPGPAGIYMVDNAYRGWKPTAEHLNTMMDVLEHFIHEAFVTPKKKQHLQDKVTKMRKTVPSRKAKADIG